MVIWLHLRNRRAWKPSEIQPGLFAEHKLESGTGLDEDRRRDLELVAEDGRRAKADMLEAHLRLVVSVAKKYSGLGLSLLDGPGREPGP